MSKMRVSISMTVEVDTDAWERDNGVSGSSAIRDDLKEYLHGIITQVNDEIRVVRWK